MNEPGIGAATPQKEPKSNQDPKTMFGLHILILQYSCGDDQQSS